jgi:hypothetical protein
LGEDEMEADLERVCVTGEGSVRDTCEIGTE